VDIGENKKMLGNNKGGFYAVIMGIMMIAGGILCYIIVTAVFYGAAGGTGLVDVAETDLGLSGDTTFETMKDTWRFVPIALIIGGLLTIVVNAQKRKYIQTPYAPV